MFHPLADEIGRPYHAHRRPDGFRIRTPADYVAWARQRFADAGKIWHGTKLHEIAGYDGNPHPPAYVSDGRWVVQCPCGNCPSAWPEHKLAVCGECGLTIEPRFPPKLKRVEAALLARPHPLQRHHFWHAEHLHHPDGSPKYVGFVEDGKPETVETLEAENARAIGEDWRARDRSTLPEHPRALHPRRRGD